MAVDNVDQLPQEDEQDLEVSEHEFTPRQDRYMDEYLLDLNQTQAAIRAGFSERSARQVASRLMTNDYIVNEIERRKGIVAERLGITQAWVLQNLQKVVGKSLQDEPVLDQFGQPTGEYKFDSYGANKALELVGKHLGMFVTKAEVNAKVKSDIKADVNLTGDATFTIKIPNSKQLTDAGDSDTDS